MPAPLGARGFKRELHHEKAQAPNVAPAPGNASPCCPGKDRGKGLDLGPGAPFQRHQAVKKHWHTSCIAIGERVFCPSSGVVADLIVCTWSAPTRPRLLAWHTGRRIGHRAPSVRDPRGAQPSSPRASRVFLLGNPLRRVFFRLRILPRPKKPAQSAGFPQPQAAGVNRGEGRLQRYLAGGASAAAQARDPSLPPGPTTFPSAGAGPRIRGG